MSQPLPPTICLDGAAVRRVREENKLTQLYVAKVVGVTTDTISRWENNRYPSIKRENALRLAEALEVEVEAIIEGGTGICSIVDEEPPPARRWYRFVPPAVVIAVLAVVYLFFHRGEVLEPGVTGARVLPSFAAPGSVIPVQVRLEFEDRMKGFILRERFPTGWKLIEADPPASSLDNVEGVARWIIKPGEENRPVSYLIQVAADAEVGADAMFHGEVVAKANGRTPPAPVFGVERIRVAPFLWADLNGDSVVDDGEMLQASDTMDEMQGVHLDWNLLEKVWDAGEYRWEAQQGTFVPVRPSHAIAPD